MDKTAYTRTINLHMMTIPVPDPFRNRKELGQIIETLIAVN